MIPRTTHSVGHHDVEPLHRGSRPWWISRISREGERKIYFLVTVAAAVWYLLTRFL